MVRKLLFRYKHTLLLVDAYISRACVFVCVATSEYLCILNIWVTLIQADLEETWISILE